MILKLKEILWEITGKCSNGCSYCGSADQWDNAPDQETIFEIANKIVTYSPLEVVISGGDPLLIDSVIHTEIVRMFKDAGILTKILVNPKSFKCSLSFEQILNLYDVVGISINTKEEADICKMYKSELPNHTVITNFNLSNVHQAADVFRYVGTKKWQIQYTMYKPNNDILSIYKPEQMSTVEYLNATLSKFINDGADIVLADNCNALPSTSCTAGTASLGVLHDGSIIPCLSMRSWVEDISSVIVGDIKKDTLQDVWTKAFSCFVTAKNSKCCKDICVNTIQCSTEKGKDGIFDIKGYQYHPFRGEYPPHAVLAYAVISPDLITTSGTVTISEFSRE